MPRDGLGAIALRVGSETRSEVSADKIAERAAACGRLVRRTRQSGQAAFLAGLGQSLFGDDGNDVVNGNAGNDAMSGGLGDDVINGGAGDDNVVYEPGGNDVISGGAGNDIISDSAGADTFNGDAGNDTIYAADGSQDVIECGPGTDSYRTDANDIRSGCEKSLN